MRRNHSTRLAALGLVLLAAALPLGAQSLCLDVSVAGVAGPRIFTDGFESGDTAAWTAPVLPAFSTGATADLEAVVALDPGLAGDHLLELRWTLAAGHLYQSVALPVAAGGELAPGATRVVPGYPFPVRVVAARPAAALERPALTVTSSLPVAGTSIVDAALWGDWQLAAFLDGEDQPCAAPAAFRLEP